ncbi:MAG: iron-containing alcohol dehydrogenase [Desulfobacterales bacterium]|jgi:alcohol dehydrogenase class IV
MLDEPTSGVSAEEKFEVMDIAMDAFARQEVTVLFVEHDMELVERYANRVLAFYNGLVIADTDTREALADPQVREYVVGREIHRTHAPQGIVSQYLFPSTALLDPELTLGLPAHVTAATGMDALIHAVEAFTSKNATTISDMLARQAMQLIAKNLRTAYADGSNLEARSNMLEGSLLAGMAFCTAGVTAVHAFAYPIGAEFHIPHGVANSIMLAPVMEFNKLGNLERFGEIAGYLGENTSGLSVRHAACAAVEAMRTLATDLKIPDHLSDFGIQDKDIPELAAGVMKVTRLLANNPRELTQKDAEAIYRSVL